MFVFQRASVMDGTRRGIRGTTRTSLPNLGPCCCVLYSNKLNIIISAETMLCCLPLIYLCSMVGLIFLDQELISYRYPSCSSSCHCSCWDDLFKNSLKLHRLKSDRDEIWLECSSCKDQPSDETGFSIFTSFHGE